MSAQHHAGATAKRPTVMKAIRALAPLVVLFWVAAGVLGSLLMPSLEEATEKHAGPMVPMDAPSQQAMLRIGQVFHESTSTSISMIVLESEGRKLDERDRAFYTDLVRKLRGDHENVQYVMDMWSKKILASGVQSPDGKSAFVMVRSAGEIGEARANESIEAIRKKVAEATAPPGLKVHVTGPAPLAADSLTAGNESADTFEIVTIAMIAVMLLVVYRSFTSMLLPWATVMIELFVGQGLLSALVTLGLVPISTFATSVFSALALGAGTDYTIFLLGRYREARAAGEDREQAYYTAFLGVTHTIVGSGLAISGAMYCMSFTKLDYFKTMGEACAAGMLLITGMALTLGPALLAIGSNLGFFDPKAGKTPGRAWRRIGAVIVRWPKPVLLASSALVLVGAVFLPTYQADYNEQHFQPRTSPSNAGFEAADRHFAPGKMNNEMLLIEADHDMRNPADMISLERAAKSVFHVPGVLQVTSITRPEGRPMSHASLGFTLGANTSSSAQTMQLTRDNIASSEKGAEISETMLAASKTQLAILEKQLALLRKTAEISRSGTASAERVQAMQDEMRVSVGYVDDYLRPFRNYFYWETNCWELPWCWAGRSMFDMLDEMDKMADEAAISTDNARQNDSISTQNIAITEQNIAIAKQNIGLNEQQLANTRSQISSQKAQLSLAEASLPDGLALGKAFDDSRVDDSFYMPPSAFQNADFKTGLQFLVSPDGKSTRFMIDHDGDAFSAAGIERARAVLDAAREGLKGTSLAGSKVHIGGAAAASVDIKDAADLDFLISGICAFALLFLIMLVITRSLAAAFVIIATVAFSFIGALGLSVMVWQNILGQPLHWITPPLTFIVLVAVGSDYNLLLIVRLQEEMRAGINTGVIRSMGSTGNVVTTAGFVFAFTMLAMVSSDLLSMRQIGSAIGMGLLLDTLIVRAFITPALVRLLGPWFWWPRLVRSRPPRPSRPNAVSASQ